MTVACHREKMVAGVSVKLLVVVTREVDTEAMVVEGADGVTSLVALPETKVAEAGAAETKDMVTVAHLADSTAPTTVAHLADSMAPTTVAHLADSMTVVHRGMAPVVVVAGVAATREAMMTVGHLADLMTVAHPGMAPVALVVAA